jgi:hypothetical protein
MTDASALKAEKDVEFAWAEASRLKQEMKRAAAELKRQAQTRRRHANKAKEDWHGRYVSVFERTHMSCTIGDALAIAEELEKCVTMLEGLKELAQQENERRRIAREWVAEHEEWERNRGSGLLQGLKDLDGTEEPKMPHLPEVDPPPFVATAPPSRDRGD